MDKSLILNKIKCEFGIKTNAEFARVLGISPQNLSNWYKRNTFDENLILRKFTNVDEHWLLTGEGEMLKSDRVTSAPASNKNIPFYDIDVTASIAESFNDTPEIPQYYIDFPPLNDCTAAFPVYGESMEPDFFAGEVVLVKEITNVDSMLWGEPYLVITNANCDNLRTIKNVYLSEDRTKFILRATNPRYAGDTIIPRDDVLKIFLVKGKVNRRQL